MELCLGLVIGVCAVQILYVCVQDAALEQGLGHSKDILLLDTTVHIVLCHTDHWASVLKRLTEV